MADAPKTEPDPRFILANERTFLAWVRTMLAIVAGAVALDSLGIPHATAARRFVVIAMLLFGAVMMLLAYRRWHAVDQAMRRGQPLPTFFIGAGMTAAVVVLAVVLVVVLI